jgi:hypothetical protein
MAKLQRDLNEFIGLLNSQGVEYLVVGGHAVAFHGHPRFTGDIDFFIRPERDNAERVLRAMKDFGFGALELGPDDLTMAERIVQLGLPPNRIDLLTSISAVSFDDAWATQSLWRARRSSSQLPGMGGAHSKQDRLKPRHAEAEPTREGLNRG